MFDATDDIQQTSWMVFLNILMVGCSYSVLKGSVKYPFQVSSKKYNIGVLLCFLFCLFSFWGTDWFHYLDGYNLIKAGFRTNFEEVYYWIIENISPHYLIFRVVVWGSALFLFLRTIDNMAISKSLALLFFSCIYIIWFAYARASLAMALAFYGLSLIVKYKHVYNLRCLLGLAIMLSSYFFHKTAAFAIGVVVLSLLLRKYSRYALWIILFTFPLVVLCAKMGVANFLVIDSDDGGDLGNAIAAGQRYMGKDMVDLGVGAMLQRFLERAPYYLIACTGFGAIRQKSLKIPQDVKTFIVLQILIVLISSVFIFDLGVNTSTVYGRFLRFAIIPTPIVMAYLYQSGYNPKLVKLSIRLAACGTLYSLLYSFYNTLV